MQVTIEQEEDQPTVLLAWPIRSSRGQCFGVVFFGLFREAPRAKGASKGFSGTHSLSLPPRHLFTIPVLFSEFFQKLSPCGEQWDGRGLKSGVRFSPLCRYDVASSSSSSSFSHCQSIRGRTFVLLPFSFAIFVSLITSRVSFSQNPFSFPFIHSMHYVIVVILFPSIGEERETERERDRETERQRERETERQRERQVLEFCFGFLYHRSRFSLLPDK